MSAPIYPGKASLAVDLAIAWSAAMALWVFVMFLESCARRAVRNRRARLRARMRNVATVARPSYARVGGR